MDRVRKSFLHRWWSMILFGIVFIGWFIACCYDGLIGMFAPAVASFSCWAILNTYPYLD